MNFFEGGEEYQEPGKPVVFKRPVKTALHQAVLDGRIHQVRLLVLKHGANVDSKDIYGRTPLMLACLLDNEEHGYKMTKIFLKAGAYVNVKDNMDRTALSFACMKGRIEIIKLFLKDDLVDLNCPDTDGNTPLSHAALSGRPEIVKMLVEVITQYGMTVDNRNELGYTPLLLACKYGHFVSGYILLTEGQASPTLRDNEFFLNAQEWILKSPDLTQSFTYQRSKTMPSMRSFVREDTMYRNSLTPQCRHFTPRSHPMGASLDTAMRLPAIFSSFPYDKPQEMSMDGVDSRLLLLKAIDDVISNPRFRPVSRAVSSVVTRISSYTYPATPKLLALTSRSHTMMVPDMGTIFKLYSDQYQPRDPRKHSLPPLANSAKGERRSQTASPSKSMGDNNPAINIISTPDNQSAVEVK